MAQPFRLGAAIIGAQKSGTTTLFSLLNRHEDVSGCRRKEPHHFSQKSDWRDGFSRYAALFPKGGLTLEASTSYSFHPHRAPEIWERLYAHNPDMRILYIVRRPMDRLVSAWRHSAARGWERRSFEAAVKERPLLLDATRYAMQIEPYLRRFGEDRVKILFLEDLKTERETVLTETVRFLGLSADGLDASPLRANDAHSPRLDRAHEGRLWAEAMHRFAPRAYGRLMRRAPPPPMPCPSPALEEAVARELSSEIGRLGALTGRDLSDWLAPGRLQ